MSHCPIVHEATRPFLPDIIRTILQAYVSLDSKDLLFQFQYTPSAALHNAKILEHFDFDISSAIAAQSNTQISFGSEFRSGEILQPLLKFHPHWPHLSRIQTSGTSFPLLPISGTDKKDDINFPFQRGNHASANKHQSIFESIIKEDIERGFA